ncbi:GIY-YIG nuclease family protein [Algoriphagus zhangzhouensis]|uniref:Putative endonuclease n=1 Tax=Algoriphagus zhangzhouensis TaxID=1073327 RepID=A0A1M7ZGB8_9BACT|nr:GIY-YIG nuclease family protein [Algoriphagus zhangzhouensis]TDY44794.1 putative endonuclease [Algoriphagus zhangzhouensis]SHO63914.1 putative endonuclease [Algoriphagus zhangzhouensis]
MSEYIVYILECRDKSFYTGVTNNLERRLSEHQEGFDPNSYTFKRRPIKLVFSQKFQNIKEAISFEKQVKGWSKKKKQAMIEGNWEMLKSYSKCNNKTPDKNKGFDIGDFRRSSATNDHKVIC